MYTSSFLSPLGFMRACSSDTGLYALDWQQKPFKKVNQENDVSRETIEQITRYFNNDLTDFTIPLDLSRYSPLLSNGYLSYPLSPLAISSLIKNLQ